MSPRPDRSPDEQPIRHALARARHDEPVPADVAARLDARLAELVRERASGPSENGAEVIEIASRRPRRWLAGAVVAAAAVTIAAATSGQWLPVVSTSEQHSAADKSVTPESVTAESDIGTDSAGTEADREDARYSAGAPALVDLTEEGLRRQVRDQVRRLVAEQSENPTASTSRRAACPVPHPPGAGVFGVRFAGQDSAAVVIGPTSGPLTVLIRSCESGAVLRRVHLDTL